MKRLFYIFTVVLITVVIGLSAGLAEDGFLSTAEEYVRLVTDFTGKNAVVMSASGYDPNKCIISFDFTDGNQTIVAIDGNQCEVFFFFDDNELMSALFRMITKFDEVEARIPSGRQLEYEIRFSETEIQYISLNTMQIYFSWIH